MYSLRRFFSLAVVSLLCVLSVHSKSVKVYFENADNWSEVYIFEWIDGNTTFGGWPGTKLTEQTVVNGKNVYVATVTEHVPGTNQGIIFNDGNNGPQTSNLEAIEGNIYRPNSTISNPTGLGNIPVAEFPTLYLRGDVNGWNCNDQYKFSCDSEGVYTLKVAELNGKFKISDVDWAIQFGAPNEMTIAPNQTYTMVHKDGNLEGTNWIAESLKNVTLTFKYVANSNLELTVTAEGVTPPDPIDPINPTTYPELYVRGNMNGWNCENAYKFSVNSEGVYSLTIPSLNGEFKISDADWKVQYGAPLGSSDTSIVPGKTYSMSHPKGSGTGVNWNANNLTNVTLSFTYAPDRDLILKVVGEGGEIVIRPEGLSGTLPVLYINIYNDAEHTSYNNEVTSYYLDHKNYFTYGEYWLDLNGCQWAEELGAQSVGSADAPLALQMKARGNWTRKGFSKKPFKLKLDKKQSLLGMTKSKHYAILAHADDNMGYLRNFVGFNLGRRIGLPWTPTHQPVEVVINGDYRGVYFLTESIRVGDGRIMIEELEDNETDPSLASGGYLVELDNYDEDNQIQMEEKGCVNVGYRDTLRITFDTPEEYSDIQRRFVTDQFTAMNDAIGANSNILWQYMDLDDAARYYVVEEIVSHTESYHGSTYLFRDRGEGQKWHFSPLWDFGNAFNGPTNDFFYYHGDWGNTWIASMRQNSKFNEKVRETWVWFMQICYNGLESDIDTYASRVKAAAEADYKRWNGQPTPSGGMPVTDNRDMDSRVRAVKEHLANKINFLKNQFGNFTALPTAAEPARDTTPAAPLPEYIQTNIVESVMDTDTTVNYYDVNGLPVSRPMPGMIVIERRGNETRKLVVK